MLAGLREIAEAMPVPAPAWHLHLGEILAALEAARLVQAARAAASLTV